MNCHFRLCGLLAMVLLSPALTASAAVSGLSPAIAAAASVADAVVPGPGAVPVATSDDSPPGPGTSRFLAVEGGRIGYDDTGGGGPLILAMPGMGDLRTQYRFLRPALQRAGYRLVTMDVRGFGDTSARWSDYSARAVAQDALALLRHLHADSAILIGNSFAAGSALWAAHDDPVRVRGVVLIGPVVRDQDVSWLSRLALHAAFAGPWDVWAWMKYRQQLFPAHAPRDHAEVDASLERNLREAGRMAALENMIFLSKADTAAMLPASQVPALVVMGTADPDFPDAGAEARWLAARLHGACLLVDGAGHYPHTEMPEQVAPAVLSFLKGLAR